MAPIGTTTCTLKLEKTHFQGPNDLVSGEILFTFSSNASHDELFCPLQLFLVLEGRMRLHVSENRTSHAYIFFNETKILFTKRQEVFSGPFRISKGESVPISFKMLFPKTTDRDVGVLPPNQELPPSFTTRFSAEAARQYGRHQGSADIEYVLRVEAELPGINVKTVDARPIVLKYTPPNNSKASGSAGNAMISQKLQIQTHQLLPEDERPKTLVEKSKAVLTNVSKPTLAFTATCTGIPDAIVVGESIRFDMRVEIDSKATTVTTAPAISLGDSKISMIACTALYATNQKGADSARIKGEDIIHTSSMTTQEPFGPFEKANDHTKVVTFSALPKDIPSSFSVTKLSRIYRAQLELKFVFAGGNSVVMKQQISLRVLPPSSTPSLPSYSASAEDAPATGSSRQPFGSIGGTEQEQLPLYEDAVRS